MHTDRPSKWADIRDRLEDIPESEHFQLASELLCYANPDGTFGRVNQAFERTLGWKTGELRGQQFISFENRYRCRDGSYLRLRWRARLQKTTQLIVAVARVVEPE